MPISDVAVRGVGRASLDALLGHVGQGSIDSAARYDALARYEELPVNSSVRGGKSWKYDLAKLDLSDVVPFETSTGVELDVEALLPNSRKNGVTIERFSLAQERHRIAFERAYGRALDTREPARSLRSGHHSIALAIAEEDVGGDLVNAAAACVGHGLVHFSLNDADRLAGAGFSADGGAV